jgi:hypothetical protein
VEAILVIEKKETKSLTKLMGEEIRTTKPKVAIKPFVPIQVEITKL